MLMHTPYGYESILIFPCSGLRNALLNSLDSLGSGDLSLAAGLEVACACFAGVDVAADRG